MYHDIPESLRALIEPVVADHGFELVTAELAGKVVRVVIDTHDGDGRLASCFDAEAAMPGAYTLEVSSPGLDRVLAREKDFSAACGREVKIETRRPIDGRRRFRGELVAFEGGRAQVRVDGKPIEIPFDEVSKANQIYHFTSADFAKKSRNSGEAR
ncbi:MAG: ribosome maturation factor RimP [Deltaproteobacteria bacterium]|nr:ribosome maturation factor RimP [Deltaproteobacteria bacterium]